MEVMGKVWVLDTETKGTGAQMVPLEQVLERPKPPAKPLLSAAHAPPSRARRAGAARRPPLPRRRPHDPAGARRRRRRARGAGGARRVSSPVDVNVYVWAPKAERWRLLTLAEKRALWERRAAQPAAT